MAAVTARDLFDSGLLFASQGRIAEAALAFQKAIMLKPDYHEAWANRANALGQLAKQFPQALCDLLTMDAILCYNQALQLSPTQADYLNNRGAAWVDLNAHEQGVRDYRKAIEHNPKLPQAHSNLGNVLKFQGDLEGARAAYRAAEVANPDYFDAKFNQGIMALELGDFEEGFKLFELRWRSGQIPPRGLPCPDWEGEDLNGKKLLLYAEQGLGDTLQFVRYATLIKEKYPDCHLTVECRLAVARLCRTVPGVDEVVVYGDPLTRQDYGCAMISAARVLGTRMETIPGRVPYMSVEQSRIDMWRKRLDGDTKQFGDRLRVGICWAGQARPMQPLANATDKRRSTLLSQWAPVAAVPGVLFVSLQAGEPAMQARQPPVGMTIAHYSDEMDDFADTAALIQNLDLVISVDTAVVHCAGALAKPVWMLSRFDGCWRWHGARRDSPWYPTLTQFRQPRLGDWGSVFERVAVYLREYSQAGRVDAPPLNIAAE